MQRPERGSYTPLDFVQWREAKSLTLTPKFQRRSVWSTNAKAYLIDTLLSGMPVPPIYLRVRQSSDRKKMIREVVDGQQRITAVLEFVDGAYALPKSFGGPRAGKRFAQLSPADQDTIRTYSFNCEVFQGISDSDVLAIFARLNTYAIQLNAQELRNGRFFGAFKQLVYGLAHDYLEYWRTHGVMTERNIARMLDAQLVSELLIVGMAGMQDKKTSIDSFYEKYDEALPNAQRHESRFRHTLDVISDAVGDALRESAFRKPPLFYTLYSVAYGREYALVGHTFRSSGPMSKVERVRLRDAVVELSDVIASAKSGEKTSPRLAKFIAACLRQTDNIKPRETRLAVLRKFAAL